jgi:hypothetical protein
MNSASRRTKPAINALGSAGPVRGLGPYPISSAVFQSGDAFARHCGSAGQPVTEDAPDDLSVSPFTAHNTFALAARRDLSPAEIAGDLQRMHGPATVGCAPY